MIPSFALAVFAIAMLNRRFTFVSGSRWAGEALGYVVTRWIGSAINLIVFSGIVLVFGPGALLIPLATGAAAGWYLTF